MLATLIKDPSERLDYTIDFGGWLEADEEIFSASWVRDPTGITIGTSSYAPTVSADGKKVTVWLESGTAGTTYTITVTIVTDNSPARTGERSFEVKVESR